MIRRKERGEMENRERKGREDAEARVGTGKKVKERKVESERENAMRNCSS